MYLHYTVTTITIAYNCTTCSMVNIQGFHPRALTRLTVGVEFSGRDYVNKLLRVVKLLKYRVGLLPHGHDTSQAVVYPVTFDLVVQGVTSRDMCPLVYRLALGGRRTLESVSA